MSASWAALAAGCWFVAFVLAHLATLHVSRTSRFSAVLVRCFALSCLGFALSIACLPAAIGGGLPERLFGAAFGLLGLLCGFVLYTPAFYVLTNSLSVETLVMIERAGGEISREQLYARFAGVALVEDRLATLARSGYLRRDDGTGVLTGRARRLIAAFAFLKRIWRLGPGG